MRGSMKREDGWKSLACALNNARSKFGHTDPAGDELYKQIVDACWAWVNTKYKAQRSVFYAYAGCRET